MDKIKIETIDLNSEDPNHNIYGCLPCPECKSVYRASYIREIEIQKYPTIECDDCRYIAKAQYL